MSAAVETVGVRVRGEARRVLWLVGAVVLVSTAIQALLASQMRSPWIVPDELIYSELAKSMAAGHLPAIRETTTFAYGIVYPLLIAPAWLLGKATNAYETDRKSVV